MNIYVTASETTYEDDGVYVDVYGRTEDRELKKVRVEGFDPYFFVRKSVAEDIDPTAYDDMAEVLTDDEELSLQGEELGKVVAKHPGAVNDLQDPFDETWEADVRFINRFRIDNEVRTGLSAPASLTTPSEIEPVDMRVEERRATFDLEVDDSNGFPTDGEERIVSIVAHDNYTDKLVGFIDTGGEPLEKKLPQVAEEQEAPGDLDELRFRPSEKKMLMEFACWVTETDRVGVC